MVKKPKKTKKGTSASKNAKKFLIKKDAIKKSTGLKDNEAGIVAKHIYRIGDKCNYGDVVAVILDIRKSSVALVNLEDFEQYTEVITDYVCYVLKTCQSKDFECKIKPDNNIDGQMTEKESGWFDKFTGDGVVVFWRLPEEPDPDEKYYNLPKYKKYEDKLELFNQKQNATFRLAIDFSIRVICQFIENTLPDIRKTCGLLPADFGISAGIDAGECLLTELKASKNADRFKRYGLRLGKIQVGHNVTVIGRPIIGATRMVSKAKPYEILINSYPGANLKDALDDPKNKVCKGAEFYLEPTHVCTKEYNPVEAYRVKSGRIEQLKKTKTFYGVMKETSKEETERSCNQKDVEAEAKNDR